jgi:hypothetical protein
MLRCDACLAHPITHVAMKGAGKKTILLCELCTKSPRFESYTIHLTVAERKRRDQTK